MKIVGAERRLEAAAVFQDVFASVPIGETEIQNFLAVERADAAGCGAEAVDEPGEFGKGGDLEDLEAAGFAGDPLGAGEARGDRLECPSYLAGPTFAL